MLCFTGQGVTPVKRQPKVRAKLMQQQRLLGNTNVAGNILAVIDAGA